MKKSNNRQSQQKRARGRKATKDTTCETVDNDKRSVMQQLTPDKPAVQTGRKTSSQPKKSRGATVAKKNLTKKKNERLVTCDEPVDNEPVAVLQPSIGLAFTAEHKQIYLQFVRDALNLGIVGMSKQFEELTRFVPKGYSYQAFSQHMDKNRYKDVTCIDQSRVNIKDSNHGYIHANHVHGDPFKTRFIATQGPLPGTVTDFWKMCIQEQPLFIIMLCECIEDGKEKCARYWSPQPGGSIIFGDIIITNGESKNEGNTEITNLNVSQNGQLVLQCHHVLWRGWPDHDVPRDIMGPVELLKMARTQPQRPTVVHCSAGIGRTGAFLAIELCLHWILSFRPLRVPEAVMHLRNMRMHCVQTSSQLIFIYRVLFAVAESCGILSGEGEQLKPLVEKFIQDYDKTIGSKQARQQAKQATAQATAGQPPVQQGVPPAQAGQPPVQGGQPPGQPGVPPAQAGLPPAQPGVPAVQAGLPPVQAGVPPVQQGLPPAQAAVPPVQAGFPPAQAGLPPVQPGVPPVQPGLPPVQAGLPPSQPGFPPVQAGVPPVQPAVPNIPQAVPSVQGPVQSFGQPQVQNVPVPQQPQVVPAPNPAPVVPNPPPGQQNAGFSGAIKTVIGNVMPIVRAIPSEIQQVPRSVLQLTDKHGKTPQSRQPSPRRPPPQ